MTAARHPTLTRHPTDDPALAEKAIDAGWYLEEDLWWVRERRNQDRELRGEEHFGFTTNDEVFVRSAECALAYDRGEIIPFKREGDAA